jgi:hypothetical protein
MQRSLIISVAPLNDPPTFSLSSDSINVTDDASSKSMFALPGFVSELQLEPFVQPDLEQQVTFLVLPVPKHDTDDFGMFLSNPQVCNQGTLSFQTHPGEHGSREFSVQAVDDGGDAQGGAAASRLKYFTILISPPIVPKANFKIANTSRIITVHEDEFSSRDFIGEQVFSYASIDWEGLLLFTLEELETTNDALFGAAPTLDPKGRLIFRTACNQSGASVFEVKSSNGANTYSLGSVAITVVEVNDAPSFDMPLTLTILEDEPVCVWHGFAYNIMSEPGHHFQDLSFYVEFMDGSLDIFETSPRLYSDGTLSLRLKKHENGIAKFNAVLKDSGGVHAGGQDTLIDYVFEIYVLVVNDAPSFDF